MIASPLEDYAAADTLLRIIINHGKCGTDVVG